MNKTLTRGFAWLLLSEAQIRRKAGSRPASRGLYTQALLFLTLLFTLPAKASHVVGGQLSYTLQSTNGTNNTYRIRLTLFRDCFGINLPNTAPVVLFNENTGSQVAALTLNQQGTLIDRSIVCPGQQSRCTNVNSTIPGVQEFIYEGDYTVAATTSFPIRVAHSTCCRANGITNLSSPGGQETYLSTIIPAQNLNLNNNSPVFLNPPNGVFCQNQLASLSLNAFDPDGDALVYSLVSARRGSVTSPQNCLYAGTFTPTSPMSSSTPVTINPATGVINFTPSVLNQRSVVAVRVDEYRNGNKIGEVYRDLEVTTINCGSNTAPVIAPINNQVVQVGQSICIPVSVTDANGHNITVTATGGIIPPATFTITSSGPGFTNGQFCFTPTLANAANTYAISINAVDNFCPIPSGVVNTFNITVPCPNAIPLQTSSTPASCGLSDGSATASMPGGVPPFAYSWTGPGGFTASSATISNLAAGSYSITVVDGNSCTGSSVVTVAGSATPITLSGPVNDAQCGQNNGSLDLSANGGVAPYTFSLNGAAAQGNGQFSNLAPGTYTITVLDANACPATATYVINAAADVTPPTALCKNATLYLDANGNANIFPADVDNGSFDNCNSITLALSAASFDCSHLGANTVTLTVTDAANNVSTCTATVNVLDNIVPDLHCQNATLYLDNNGQATLTIPDVLDHEHEPCPITNTWLSQSTFNCANLGTNTVTVFATDNSNNTGTCTATVTVLDTIAPVLSCAGTVTVNNTPGLCSGTASLTPPGFSDNCAPLGPGPEMIVNGGFSSGAAGWNACGNWVEVFPETAYGGWNPSNLTAEIDHQPVSLCQTISGFQIGATYTLSFDATRRIPSPATVGAVVTINGGALNATVTRSNTSYNMTTETFTFTATQTTHQLSLVPSAGWGGTLGLIVDNFSVKKVNGTLSNNAPATYPVGTTTVTWTANDGNGNTTTCSQTVTVVDNEAPSITCGNAVTVSNDASLCGAAVTLNTPATGDNCGVANVSSNAPAFFNVGTTTVTWTVTDIHNNSNTCTQDVTVNDTEAPIASCQPFTLNLLNGTGTVSPADVNNGSMDNCGITSMSVSPNTFTCADAGVQTVTLTVVDANNNSSSCTAQVTVQYQPSCSIVSVPANNVYTGGNPNNIYLGYGPQSATLNSSANGGNGFTYSWSPATYLSCTNCASPVFTPTAAGTITYTLTVTNSNGCTTTCEITMCVIDARATGKGNNGKVLICHVPPGNPNNPQTLSISPNAVNTHLTQHAGDQLGACGNSCGVARGVAETEGQLLENEGFETIVYPNPTSREFSIMIHSESESAVKGAMYDMTGKKILDLMDITPNMPYTVSHPLANGMYLIKIEHNGHQQAVRLIRQD